jgi:arylsulfatase
MADRAYLARVTGVGLKNLFLNPLAALLESSAPDLKNKSFTITAEAEIPAGGTDGMIFTQGGFTGGWGFYVQQGKLVGEHSYVAIDRYRVVSTEPVPIGKVTLAMDSKYDGGGMGKGGTISLFANGRKIGEGRVQQTTPFKYALSEGQNIGEDTGTGDAGERIHATQILGPPRTRCGCRWRPAGVWRRRLLLTHSAPWI